MKQFKIEQFPKNKIITNLSKEQKELRRNQKKYTYDKTKLCNTCMTDLDINEYYIKDSHTGRRANRCRDCQLKISGVIEIGKIRFGKLISDKGFRRCSVCKDTKPLSMYRKNKKRFLGLAMVCKSCASNVSIKWRAKQAKEITDWYIINYYGKNLGYTVFDKNTIEKLRNEVINKRKPKYLYDKKEFLTKNHFARYVFKKYGIGFHTVVDRITKGFTMYECTLSRSEFTKRNKAKEVNNG